jgi:hypothetical protein
MIIACCFMTLCAIQLATVANAYQIYNYPKIAYRALGNWGF